MPERTCRCEALVLADQAHVDQLAAEAADPATSPERRRAIIAQFKAEVRELAGAIAQLVAGRGHA